MGYALEFYALEWPQARRAAEAGGEDLEKIAAALAEAGEFLGALTHSSTGGEVFREEFLLEAARRAEDPELPAKLTERDVLPVQGEAYPSFGGLTREEVSAYLPRLESRPWCFQEPELEESVEIWLDELTDILETGREAGTAIVTVYR